MIKKMKTLLPLIIALLLFQACGTTTKVTNSWKDPDYNSKAYKKVAVVAISKENIQRKQAELSMVEGLKYYKINAIISYDFFSISDTSLSQEAIQKKFTDQGCDAILTVMLVDVQKSKSYVTYNDGPTYYGGFGGYYGYGYGMAWSYPTRTTTYEVENTNIVLESRFYDLGDSKLVWGAITTTTDPNDFKNLVDSYARAVSQELIREKVLHKEK
jgi:hypothetical protein